jgi:hypothetical protein
MKDMRGHSRDPLAQEESFRHITPQCIRDYAERQKKAEYKRIAADFTFGVFCLFCVVCIIAFFLLGGVTGQ